jgi:serine/threonine protein kinase
VYMSPEQLQDGDPNGQGYLGTAVDVWAAGVLLIVMLLGGSERRMLASDATHHNTCSNLHLCAPAAQLLAAHCHHAVPGIWRAASHHSCVHAGTFPFDHTENPDPNCKEAHTEVWAQQTKGSWSEVPHIKKAVQKVRPAV